MTSPVKSFLSPSFKPKAMSFSEPSLFLEESPLLIAPDAPPAAPPAGRRRGLAIEPAGVLSDIVQERQPIRRDKKAMEEKIREHIELFNTPGVSMDSIHFCFFSPQEVANFSVVELKEPKLEGRGGLYDLRMGPSERNESCETCGERREKCPGHFGHIPLNVPIPHPLCSKSIIDFLHCFCYKCHRLVMTEDEIKLKKLHLLKGHRFEAILEEIKKNLDRCMHPDCKQVLVKKYSFDDDKYYKTLKTGEKKPLLYSEIVDIFNDIAEDDLALLGLKDERYTIYNKDNTFEDSLVYPSRLILKNLPVLPPCARPYQISDNEKSHDDLTLLYKDIIVHNNDLGKPEKLNEMSFQTELGRLVTKIHILFDNDKKKVPKPSQKQPYYGIKERISGKHGHIRKYLLGKRTNFSARTVIGGDNTIGVNEVAIPPQVASNLSVPIEVTATNLKHCQNLLNEGKVNWIWKPNSHKENDAHGEEFTNTDPTYYRMDDLIILPREDGTEERCDIYTFLMGKHPSWFDASGVVIEKEKVSNELSNYQMVRREYVKTSVDQKPDSSFYEGDIQEKKHQSDTCILQETLKPPRLRKTFPLRPGYKIERQVQDGDWVVFNRQPTLWKGSMQSKQVKILPGKTFRMNLATTEAFNADHDGDEMNISLPQNPDAISEIKELMSTNETFISSKSTSPMLTLKEDMMTGWYTLSKGLVPVKKEIWMDAVIHLGIEFITKKITHIRKVYKTSSLYQEVKQAIQQNEEETLGSDIDIDTLVLDRLQYSGFGLFSVLCPDDFEMVIHNGKSKDGKPVHITQGTMISGTFDKEALGSSSGSLIHHLAKDYGNRFASNFIVNLQRFVCDVFQHIGFSVGMKDFIPSSREPIDQSIEKAFFKVISHMENQPDPYIRELKIRYELSMPNSEGLAFANKTLSPETNSLVAMVECGSKGSWVNIASITSVIGQQFVLNQRIRKVCAGRTLSCFPRYSYRTDAVDELPLNYSYIDVVRILQSRGFIRNGYFNGLSPVEYFMICPGGRSGLIDTAITTAETGYIQRKIAKILEDLQVSYTGTVVTPSQNVIQFAYGGDNLDAARLICYEKNERHKPVHTSFVDIQHVTERLNKQFEVKQA